jgi:tRNA threonylcarbamoyladenosine biosynthesis protein TsaB
VVRLNSQDFKASGPIILALDTTSKATSIAIARGGQVLKSIAALSDEKRSEKLWVEVQSLLVEIGMTVRDVDLFSVCVGPGGFTGLRVGIAAVKGLCAALGKPVVGVTSLEAAAFSAAPAPLVCAMVNAYKSEVYSQLFSFNGDGVPIPQNDAIVSAFDEALRRIRDAKEVVFAGDGAEAGAEAIRSFDAAREEGKWSISRSDRCIAEDVARLAFLKHGRGEVETAASLKACYVRLSEAEIKLSLGLLGSKIKRSMKSK